MFRGLNRSRSSCSRRRRSRRWANDGCPILAIRRADERTDGAPRRCQLADVGWPDVPSDRLCRGDGPQSRARATRQAVMTEASRVRRRCAVGDQRAALYPVFARGVFTLIDVPRFGECHPTAGLGLQAPRAYGFARSRKNCDIGCTRSMALAPISHGYPHRTRRTDKEECRQY
jgi:hypothetical protein